MFDEISIKCPKCGKYFIEQSKAGRCILRSYSLNDLSTPIAQNLLKSEVYCTNCGARIKFVPEIVINLIPYIDD